MSAFYNPDGSPTRALLEARVRGERAFLRQTQILNSPWWYGEPDAETKALLADQRARYDAAVRELEAAR